MAWFAKPVMALPDSVTLTNEQPYLNVEMYFDGQTVFHVEFNSNRSCSVQGLDPIISVFNMSNDLVAFDDDSNYNAENNCFASKLHYVPAEGSYIIQFGRYGDSTGTGTVYWGAEYLLPPEPTTTTSENVPTTTENVATSTEPTEPPTTITETTTIQESTTTWVEFTNPTATPSTIAATTSVPVTIPTTTLPTISTSTITTLPQETSEAPSTVAPTVSAAAESTSPTETTLATETTQSPEIEPITTEAPSEPPQNVDQVEEAFAGADTEEETVAIATELLGSDLTAEELSEVLTQVFDEPLSDEAFAEVLDAILNEPISDEQFEVFVEALTSGSATDEQISEAVDQLLSVDIAETQAVALVGSAEILQAINGEQASNLFDVVVVDNLTEEQAAAIVEALADAPPEVKNAFQEEINVFGGKFDFYIPTGSNVSVVQRRTIVAGVTAVSILSPAPRKIS
jgi:hypothetical protein